MPSSSSAPAASLSSSSSPSSPSSPSLYRETPLIHSIPLSRLCQRDVYLKLDCLQASGSFKDRGMAILCQALLQDPTQRCTQFCSSSGGNAGLAVATVGQRLQVPVHVIVPQTTKPNVIDKLRNDYKAQVTIHGANWNEADAYTRAYVAEQGGAAAYISPYDHPLLWQGHSTVVGEIAQQLPSSNPIPAAIVVSVGGGGLLCGVLQGIAEHETWKDAGVAVVAAETVGASSFGQAWAAGELVRLSSIDSIATSLGALQVTPVALERAQAHVKNSGGGAMHALQCTDAEAVQACCQLANDHRLLVEPACGAALAMLYSERLRAQWIPQLDAAGAGAADTDVAPKRPIVVEICGGSGVTLDLLQQWKRDFLSS